MKTIVDIYIKSTPYCSHLSALGVVINRCAWVSSYQSVIRVLVLRLISICSV